MASFRRQMLPGFFGTGAFTSAGFILDQSTDAAEVIFKSATLDPITRLGFRVHALTGTATTWKLSLQGVDAATGYPDGTIKGGGTPASVTFTNSSLAANGWYWFNLANSYTPTRGEDLAMVIAYDSGTAPSVGVNDLTITSTGGWSGTSLNPYAIQNAAGTRTKQSGAPVFGYGTSGTAFGQPMKTASAPAPTTTNEVAIHFNIPTTHCSSYQVVGARILVTATAGGSTTARVYTGTTALQDVVIDHDNLSSATLRWLTFYFDESTLATLSAGSDYRIALLPTSGTMALNGFLLDAAADWAAYPGAEEFYTSTRAGGAWTDQTTQRIVGELIFEDWTVPSASGGVLLNSGMLGGLRG